GRETTDAWRGRDREADARTCYATRGRDYNVPRRGAARHCGGDAVCAPIGDGRRGPVERDCAARALRVEVRTANHNGRPDGPGIGRETADAWRRRNCE